MAGMGGGYVGDISGSYTNSGEAKSGDFRGGDLFSGQFQIGSFGSMPLKLKTEHLVIGAVTLAVVAYFAAQAYRASKGK